MKVLTVTKALYYFEILYSDDTEIQCLPADSSIVTDEKNAVQKNLCDDLPRDTSGKVQLSVYLKSMDNQEICDLVIKITIIIHNRRYDIISES